MNQSVATPQHLLKTSETTQNTVLPERLLRLSKVEESTSFKSSHIYELIKKGEFPAPVKIGNASMLISVQNLPEFWGKQR